MNKKSLFKNMVIRTAAVRLPEVGYIFCGDIKKEEDEIPYTATFRWNSDKFEQGNCNFSAHAACIVENPAIGFILISEIGYYVANTKTGTVVGDIIENSHPKAKGKRHGGFRSVSQIAGKAYAVGFNGMVYRLDKSDYWTRIDDGLPATFNIDAIHGYTDSDIYAVGNNGNLWHFDGKNWQKHELPTNLHLYAVNCAGDGVVYVAGDSGVLMKGNKSIWEIVDHDATEEDIWDLEWFNGKLYVSTLTNLYWLNGDQLEPVSFGKDKPKSFYQLSAAPGVLWSVGEFDIMSFDGQQWSRVV